MVRFVARDNTKQQQRLKAFAKDDPEDQRQQKAGFT